MWKTHTVPTPVARRAAIGQIQIQFALHARRTTPERDVLNTHIDTSVTNVAPHSRTCWIALAATLCRRQPDTPRWRRVWPN